MKTTLFRSLIYLLMLTALYVFSRLTSFEITVLSALALIWSNQVEQG